MKVAIEHREELMRLSPVLVAELDSMYATLFATFTREHTWDGRHSNITVESIGQTPLSQEAAARALIVQQSFLNNFTAGQVRNVDNQDFTFVTGSGGLGDVVGPASAVSGDLATFDGATGKLIKDGGTFAAALAGVSGLSFISVPLTLAQMQNLNTTAVTMIAGEAGKILIPIWWAFYDIRGSVAWTATPSLTLRYANSTSFNHLNSITLRAGANIAPATRFSVCGPKTTSSDQVDCNAPNDLIGATLEVTSTGNFTGGGVGGSWTVYIAYGKITP